MATAAQYRERYRADVEFAMKERLRRQMRKANKASKYGDLVRLALYRGGKSPSFSLVVGYSMDELRQHLESRFTEGMSWQAFMDGEIHIDHLIPVRAFNMAKAHEVRMCWSLTNLYPAWAGDNMGKSDLMPCGRSARMFSRDELDRYVIDPWHFTFHGTLRKTVSRRVSRVLPGRRVYAGA